MGTAIKRQSARMSKITNDGLTQSGTGCFIAVHSYSHGNSGRQRVKLNCTVIQRASNCRPIHAAMVHYMLRNWILDIFNQIKMTWLFRNTLHSGWLWRRNCWHNSSRDGLDSRRTPWDLQGNWRTSRLCWSVYTLSARHSCPFDNACKVYYNVLNLWHNTLVFACVCYVCENFF